MKLGTIRTATGTAAVRLDGDAAVEIAPGDVAAVLSTSDWRERAAAATGQAHDVSTVDWAPVVTAPQKVICVGLNYTAHIEEMGRELPKYPTLFPKFANSLIGARDELVLPSVSRAVDWEVELCVVIGAPARRLSPEQSVAAIGGYTVLNDISMRDWQARTSEWLQGKAFENSTPVGPVLDTDVDASDLEVRCEVDGAVMQRSRTSDLLFKPADIVSYISQFTTLLPGDLIATGTPAGVGAGRDPKVFLQPGQVVRTVVDGIGECVNTCVAEA